MKKWFIVFIIAHLFNSSVCHQTEINPITDHSFSRYTQIWDYVYRKHPVWSIGVILTLAGVVLYHTNKNVKEGVRTMLGLQENEMLARSRGTGCPFLAAHSDEVIQFYDAQCPFLREHLLFDDEKEPEPSGEEEYEYEDG